MEKYAVEIKTPDAFTQKDKTVWAGFRKGNPALYSPYFHFEYTEVLGKLRADVHVLCISRDDKIIAFLPFQADVNPNEKIGFARPIGAPMTDYHGFICAQSTQFDVTECMRQAGFGAFHFSALVKNQNMRDIYMRSHAACTVMDISKGAQAWREVRNSSYRRHLKNHRRRVRKANELGARKIVFNCKDQNVFDQLLSWKREKFAETGKYDVLSTDWTRALLQTLWQEQGELHADMHALYFGDTLAAIDFGLSDGVTFHSWMVAYNNELQHLAPGIQLLEELIDGAGELGYNRIDLGEGIDGYKRHYVSEDVRVASGFIALNGPAAALSQIYGVAERFGESKLGTVGKLPGKARRRYGQIRACEPGFGGRAKAMLAAVKGAG